MQTDTVSIERFIKANRITSKSVRTDRNPNMPDSGNMDHWKVTLRSSNRRMTLYFSKGFGHHGAEPATDEVLACLASEAATIANAQDFEDFCSELGYDSDSRKAEKIYKACVHSAARLQTFLGSELFEQLLYHTERM